MTDINKDIGERIKIIRTRLGLTQTELGDLLGVEKASISKYEAGDAKRGVPVEFLVKIAELGKCSVDWLINGSLIEVPVGIGKTKATAEIMQSLSQSRIDLGMIKQVIEVAMEHLQSNNLEMAPDKFAELIEVLYEEISESGAEQVNKGTVARLIKLAM